MASDHVEIHLQPAASIVSKCKIHTLEQYMVILKTFYNMSDHVQHTWAFLKSFWNPAGTSEQNAQGLLLQIHLPGQSTMLACTLASHTSSCANMSWQKTSYCHSC